MSERSWLAVLTVGVMATGCGGNTHPPVVSSEIAPSPPARTGGRFLPPSLDDEWTRWIQGEWEGTGESNAGRGRGTAIFELALSGQFLIQRGRAEITELDPVYLKQHMHASDEEIARFQRQGYESLEVYTVDPVTGDILGFLFDNLRCVATGRGRREGRRETIEWQWRTGHRSTRITERAGDDRMVVIEETRQEDGSVMRDRGEMVRVGRRPADAR